MTELEQICALPINLAIKLTAGNELSHSGNANLMIIAEMPNNVREMHSIILTLSKNWIINFIYLILKRNFS